MRFKKFTVVMVMIAILCGVFGNGVSTAQAEVADPIDRVKTMIELRQKGEFEESIKMADQLLKEDSMFMEAYSNKAIAYFQLDQPAEALEVLKLQLKINPNNQLALYNAACAASLLGQTDQSISYLQRLLALDIECKINISEDEDFDPIRKTEAYQRLMGISVQVDGELLTFDVPPSINNGRTMLPMRTIFEALDAEIAWDSSTKTITIDYKIAWGSLRYASDSLNAVLPPGNNNLMGYLADSPIAK